jgi:ATP-dependent DNA helicase RecQ
MVTPLIALGRQQMARFKQMGIETWSGVGESDQVQFPERRPGVYVVSPERLIHQREEISKKFEPEFYIFDEAHCVFEWGEHFRPAFAELIDMILVPAAKNPSTQKTFWCSATLRPEMIEQIQKVCGPETRILGQFKVPEHIEIQRIQLSGGAKLLWLERYLSIEQASGKRGVSGLIYVGTRKLAVRLEEYLKHSGFRAYVYHAGMSAEERRALEEEIEKCHRDRRVFLVIATSAFGMGMDYPALRFAVLFDPPYSMLQLAQTLGRVGRSGLRSQVFAFWCAQDFARMGQFLRTQAQGLQELHRLQEWYCSPLPARLALERDFRVGLDSETSKTTHFNELSVDRD